MRTVLEIVLLMNIVIGLMCLGFKVLVDASIERQLVVLERSFSNE